MSGSEAAVDADAALLAEHGYEQELHRALGLWSTFAFGFAAISPVVGIYAVITVAMTVVGPAWIWVVPISLAMQLTVASVYAELASQFPIAGGPYQWTRRLIGDRLGWFTGFLYLAGAMAALTTVAYLGAAWLSLLLTSELPSPHMQVLLGAVFLVVSLAMNLFGINPLRYVMNAGIAAEAVASIGLGLVLLLFFRNHSLSLLFDTLGAEAASGGSVGAGFLAALAVGGWAFLGFDSCAQVSEETRDARREVPRAIRSSLIVVGSVVLLTAFAVTLSYHDPSGVVSGKVVDPVTPAVTDALGAWAEKPFVAVVLIAFIACAMSIQTYTGRSIYGMARDDMLPGSAALRQVGTRKVPYTAMGVATLLSAAGLLLGLNASAVGTLIAFGSGGFYIVFLIVATTALYARLTGRWDPDKGALRLGRRGLALNVIAVVWLAFETVNIAWPRAILVPPGAPWLQQWAVIVVFAGLVVLGLVYLFTARPDRRVAESAMFNPVTEVQ